MSEVTCDQCQKKTSQKNLKRHKTQFCKKSVPKPHECADCKHTFITAQGLRKHSEHACEKKRRVDMRVTCDCGVTLKLEIFASYVCNDCEIAEIQRNVSSAPTIKLHGCYSSMHTFCEDDKQAPMFSENDVKKQVFDGDALVGSGRSPTHLRLGEPISMDAIPDNPQYHILRETVQNLITLQNDGVNTFCVHSDFWRVLQEHANKCELLKKISQQTKEDIMRTLKLPADDPCIDAHVLYWIVFSPHAAVVIDIGLCNYFPVHPILSLPGPVRVWSHSKNHFRRYHFYHFLKRRLFVSGDSLKIEWVPS